MLLRHLDFLLDRVGVSELAGHLLKLFDAGQLVDVLEAETDEEILGGFLQDRAADNLLAAGGGDELARDETAEDATGVDAADLGDFGRCDRLFIGNDRKNFPSAWSESFSGGLSDLTKPRTAS